MKPTLHRDGRGPLLALLVSVAVLAAGCGSVAKPQGWAGPAIRDDIAYVSHDAGKLGAYRLTGPGRLWEFPGKDAGLKLEGLYGTPVLADDTVYVTGYSGEVAAVAAADGAERWRLKAGARVIGATLVTADTVYAGTDAGELVAINRTDGTVRWRQSAGNQIWATPVTDGRTIFVAAMDGSVVAFNADGTQRWRRKVAGAAIAGAPALRDGVLYLGSYDRRLYAVDAGSGETRWRSESAGNWFWTEPIIDGDTLVAGNLDGSVYALDSGTGQPRWKANVGAPVRGRTAIADGVVVVPASNGRLWGLRSQSGESAWEPALVGGKLYADLTTTRTGLYLASEVGKKSHKLYRVDAAAGAVTEVPLSN